MPSTSSLLRSASSTRKKVLSQRDAEAEYDYSLGYKSYEDYRAYDDYLEKRLKTSADPGAALSLQKKRNSAFRGYMGNEIQRQSIAVIEGRQSNTDKYNAMYQLYQQAAANGLYDTAQTLYLQLGSLDRTIQNEATAAAGSASASMKAAVTAVKDEVKAHQQVLKDLGSTFAEVGPDAFDQGIREIAPDLIAAYPDLAPAFQAGGQIGIFDIAAGVMENIKDTYARGISELPPEEAGALQESLNKLVAGDTKFDIPGFADKVSLKDMQTQIAQAREGRNYFFRGQDGTLVKGKTTDYTWDKEGKVIPVYANPLSAGTKDNPYLQTVDDFGATGAMRRDEKGDYVNEKGEVVARSVVRDRRDESGNVVGTERVIVDASGKEFTKESDMTNALNSARVNAETLLKEQGFNVVAGADGRGTNGGQLITVTEATREKLGGLPGVQNGDAVEVFVDGQGNLRFTDRTGTKLYQSALGADNQYRTRELAPGEQGAINANTLKDLALDMTDVQRDLATKRVSSVTGDSLIASNERIAQGVGFTRGVLKDAETRRRFLAGEAIQNARNETVVNDVRQNPALRLNPAERVINSAANTVVNAPRQARAAATAPLKTLSSVLNKIVRGNRPGTASWGAGAANKVSNSLVDIFKSVR